MARDPGGEMESTSFAGECFTVKNGMLNEMCILSLISTRWLVGESTHQAKSSTSLALFSRVLKVKLILTFLKGSQMFSTLSFAELGFQIKDCFQNIHFLHQSLAHQANERIYINERMLSRASPVF